MSSSSTSINPRAKLNSKVMLPLLAGLHKRNKLLHKSNNNTTSSKGGDIKAFMHGAGRGKMTQSNTIVSQMLKEIWATRIISNWLYRCYKRRQSKKSEEKEKDNTMVATVGGSGVGMTRSHTRTTLSEWMLLKELSNPSLSIRRVVSSMLLDATNPLLLHSESETSSTDNDMEKKGRLHLNNSGSWYSMREVLISALYELVQKEMNSFLYKLESTEQSDGEEGLFKDEGLKNQKVGLEDLPKPPAPHGIIQLYGILTYLICDDDDILYCKADTSENTKKEEIGNVKSSKTSSSLSSLAMNDVDKEHAKYALLRFISRGGLKWVTQTILNLICVLLRQDGASSSFGDVHHPLETQLTMDDEMSDDEDDEEDNEKNDDDEDNNDEDDDDDDSGDTEMLEAEGNKVKDDAEKKSATETPIASLMAELPSPSVHNSRHFFHGLVQTGYMRSLSDATNEEKCKDGEIGGRNSTRHHKRRAFVALSDADLIEELQTRITLLVDFCHRIVMFASLHPMDFPKGILESALNGDDINDSSLASQKGEEKDNDEMDTDADVNQKKKESVLSFLSPSALSASLRTVSSSKPTAPSITSKLNSSTNTTAPIKKGVDADSRKEAIEKIEKERKSNRRGNLEKVHNLLWNLSKSSSNSDNVNAAHSSVGLQSPLSPLACLIAALKVLKCSSSVYTSSSGQGASSSSTAASIRELTSRTALLTSSVLSSSSGGGSGNRDESNGTANSASSTLTSGALGHEYGPTSTQDYSLLPTPIRGLEKTIAILERLIDPSAKVVVLPATYSSSSSNSAGGTSSKRKCAKGGTKTSVADRSRKTRSDSSSSSNTKNQGEEGDGGNGPVDIFSRSNIFSRSASVGRFRRKRKEREIAAAYQQMVDSPSGSGTNRGIGEDEAQSNNGNSASRILEQNRRKRSRLNIIVDNDHLSEDEISSSAARAILRAVDMGDRTRSSEGTDTSAEAVTRQIQNLVDRHMDEDDHNEEEEEDEEKDENVDHEDGECVENEDCEEEDEEEDVDEDEEEDVDEDDEEDVNEMEMVDAEDDEEIDSDEENNVLLPIHEEDASLVEDVMVEDGEDGPFGSSLMDEDDEMVDVGEIHHPGNHSDCPNSSGDPGGPPSGLGVLAQETSKNSRKEAFIRASVEVLEAQHPLLQSHSNQRALMMSPILSPSAEQSLIQSLCDIVKPPKKPLNLKVYLKRAPTQEEFFRGSLSRNPIPLSSLKANSPTTTAPSDNKGDQDNEPRVYDLRQHIANDLQMSDSAELLELLVANQILDVNLKLRVVCQVLWKKHVLENEASGTIGASSGSMLASVISGRQMISSGSGLSMVFGFNDRGEPGPARARINENTPVSLLPAMVVTYRLAGIDGEATEDKVEEGDLVDPDSPAETGASGAEYEKKMQKEFGITRLITRSRGVTVLLRSIESNICMMIQRIRRDDANGHAFYGGNGKIVTKNSSRSSFFKSPPCPALILLRYCARLTDNKKKMLKAQAPTILLRLLLDVLNSIDIGSSKQITDQKTSNQGTDTTTNNSESLGTSEDVNDNEQAEADSQPMAQSKSMPIGNNPTANALQELIETLSSEISVEEERKNEESQSKDIQEDDIADNDNAGGSALPMLLKSLRTTSLSPPLRKVIAKLLPFLTYGQITQSRALAANFVRHINIGQLGESKLEDMADDDNKAVLMQTFVDAAIHLPPVAICDNLRSELIRQGFVSNIKAFVLCDIPSTPPSWSPALTPKEIGEKTTSTKSKREKILGEKKWRNYYNRTGLQTALRILTGICTNHSKTQALIADLGLTDDEEVEAVSLLTACHWIESTSDNTAADISTNGLGILAETLLDTLMHNNKQVNEKISLLRKSTRDRKKQIAEERRNKALGGMNFHPLAITGKTESNSNTATPSVENSSGGSNEGSKKPNLLLSITNALTSRRGKGQSDTSFQPGTQKQEKKPAWLLEMEQMEDESGLTCAICQEGKTLQPTELLGLYAFMKKVTIPSNRGGDRAGADGTLLFNLLPRNLPPSLRGTSVEYDLFLRAQSTADSMRTSSYGANSLASITSSSTPRPSSFITTVTAGNAIHFSCHAKAKLADRNHPKAPKSEWEGASLRNSRVSCNVILPLISAQTSEVPMLLMENALENFEALVTNQLGVCPKSMLWNSLHDVRLLMLRMAYGETLSADCGGGSLSSNAALVFHMLSMAGMFSNKAEHEAPETMYHARDLTYCFLTASNVLKANDYVPLSSTTRRLRQGLIDASPMVGITCILFHNGENADSSQNKKGNSHNKSENSPSPKRLWSLYREEFLSGMIQCAGRRHALGIDGSGCESSRGSMSGRRARASSFSDWDESDNSRMQSPGGSSSRRGTLSRSETKSVEDYATALRPMMTLFATLDKLSETFSRNMDDDKIEEASEQFTQVVEACQGAKNIRALMRQANVELDDSEIVRDIELGLNSV